MESLAQPKTGLNGSQLKWIAVAAMTVDHLTWVIFPGYSLHPAAIVLHLLGRVAAPIFCFFIAEGFFHTHDVKRYLLRILLFAIPSHFAYLFCFGHPLLPDGLLNQTSVLWAFAGGLVLLASEYSKLRRLWKILIMVGVCIVTFPADWSCIGALVIFGFGCNRGNFKMQAIWLLGFVAMYAAVYACCLDVTYGILQMGVVLALPLLKQYNGQRGGSPRRGLKWGFYIYYPLHLVLIGLLRVALQG